MGTANKVVRNKMIGRYFMGEIKWTLKQLNPRPAAQRRDQESWAVGF
jgi:hypothetical protein